ncbi:6878_t:CDS:2 [Ambispora gerdemannii]|uniref:6878_t:CDS:1 n=1 Tax=Ambispora gerdemannii TaxID=144530 RepID=A0A9N8WJ60_9GLOM|nr:6878_t:CDS:2 [Ambispora gerdemannii]
MSSPTGESESQIIVSRSSSSERGGRGGDGNVNDNNVVPMDAVVPSEKADVASSSGGGREGVTDERVIAVTSAKAETSESGARGGSNSESGRAATSTAVAPESPGKSKLIIDREKTCPFLLRIFCQEGAHHKIEKYTNDEQPVQDEVQIYTWKDATLKELANLIKSIKPEAQRINARISFKLVYQDQLRNCYMFKYLGLVMNSRSTVEENTNLDDARFVIGDFLDVAVFYGIAPPPPQRSLERRSRGGRDARERRDRERAADRDRNGVRITDRDRDRGGREGGRSSFRDRRR